MSFDDLVTKAMSSPPDYQTREDYYEGKVHLDALGVNLPPQTRILEMIAPFPKMAVDVLVESLTPQGFLLSGDPGDVAAKLRRWWQVNDLDTTCRLAFTEALVQGSAYWIVGDGTRQAPRVTAHPGRGIAASYDHMGALTEAVQVWRANDKRYAAHYLPGVTRWYEHAFNHWKLTGEKATGVDRPTIVPMFNRARLGDTEGRSEITELMMISDAASRSLTNLQVAQELLAMPLRYIFGKGLTEAIGTDPMNRVRAYYNNLLTGPENASAGQLAGADLSQIINSYKLYAQQISAITGIPPAMLGISTDNPASAEALRVSKERLITRAEVKQELFGDALEEVARLMLDLMGAGQGADLSTLEVQWRDPATPSQSAYTAAMLQAQAQGVITSATAREALRLTPEQQARENAASHDELLMTG